MVSVSCFEVVLCESDARFCCIVIQPLSTRLIKPNFCLNVVSVEDFPELVVFGKVSIRTRNLCPMLVLVFLLKGGLY